MNCPYCDGPSKVVDSRPIPDGIRRRRECLDCERRFTTHERLAPAEIRVVKQPGRGSEPFDPEKIARAVARVGRDDGRLGEAEARGLARRIEAELVDAGRTSIRSAEIAERVLALLLEVDRLAAARFVADYTDLDGNVTFQRPGEVEELEEEQFPLFAEREG
jgi:transcriptional repressor NrdR